MLLDRHAVAATPLRNGDVLRIIRACPAGRLGRRDAALIGLMVEGALRGVEAARLLWDDIEGRSARIRPVKRSRGRVVVMSWAQRRRLDDWAAHADPADPRVFNLAARSVPRVVNTAGRRAGVEGLSGHSARRGSSQDGAAAGLTDVQLQALGGWRRPETMRLYAGSAAAEAFTDGPPPCISTDPAARAARSSEDLLADLASAVARIERRLEDLGPGPARPRHHQRSLLTDL